MSDVNFKFVQINMKHLLYYMLIKKIEVTLHEAYMRDKLKCLKEFCHASDANSLFGVGLQGQAHMGNIWESQLRLGTYLICSLSNIFL